MYKASYIEWQRMRRLTVNIWEWLEVNLKLSRGLSNTIIKKKLI